MLVKICRQHLDVQSRTASLHLTSRSAFWFSTSSGYLGNWCRIVSTHCLWNSAFHAPTWTTSHQPKLSLSFLILVLILAPLTVANIYIYCYSYQRTVNTRSTHGQHTVNIRSTYGQHAVNTAYKSLRIYSYLYISRDAASKFFKYLIRINERQPLRTTVLQKCTKY